MRLESIKRDLLHTEQLQKSLVFTAEEAVIVKGLIIILGHWLSLQTEWNSPPPVWLLLLKQMPASSSAFGFSNFIINPFHLLDWKEDIVKIVLGTEPKISRNFLY